MRIGMVVFDFMEFGGLEEIVVALAWALQARGHQIAIVSTGWVPKENQYRKALERQKIPFYVPPKGLFNLAVDWSAKEKMTAKLMVILKPVVFIFAFLLFLRRRSWRSSFASARGWLNGRLMDLIGPNRRQWLAKMLLTWFNWRWRPDLIHIHGYTTTLMFALDWTSHNNIPSVYEEHQTPDTHFDWWDGMSDHINKATCVVAVSEASASALREICHVRRPLFTVTPIVADPCATVGNDVLALRLYDHDLDVSVVARLGETKGLDYLLNAVASVKKQYPNIHVRVWGDGPLRHDLLSQAQTLGLDGEQIFVGSFAHQDLPQIMSSTDIFLMPSILEGLPLALIEAMAYGRPIVATTVGGIPELIEDGISGLLCPPKDSYALAEKLNLLIENPVLRQTLGKAARRTYEQGPFHPEVVCERFVSIYRAALAEGHQ